VLFGMVGLSVAGSLIGLVPPLALGALVNSLTAGHRGHAAVLAGLIAAAVLAEATAYAVSDGLYGVTTARLFRDIRLLMFRGVLRRPPLDVEATSGLSSRFVSDAETLEQLTVATLDLGAIGLFELGAALVALGVLRPWAVAIVGGLIVLAALVARRTQAPVAEAGERRQEALEGMSRTLATALAERNDPERAQRRFRVAATRVLQREIRLGWLRAANYHGSGALAGLGPVCVVVVAAFQGGFKAGTLLSLYLLAERAFRGADSLLDLKLDVEVVRGAVSRCFQLIDTPERDVSS
jgi:ABC-type multidrug transport system fused ATPase/permease subunit